MDGRMDRQMDGQTDTPSYKMSIWFPCNALQLEKKYVFAVVFVVMLLLMVVVVVVVLVVVVVVMGEVMMDISAVHKGDDGRKG